MSSSVSREKTPPSLEFERRWKQEREIFTGRTANCIVDGDPQDIKR
jgi:hypothetical protein